MLLRTNQPFQMWRHQKLHMHFMDTSTGLSYSFEQVSELKPLNKTFLDDKLIHLVGEKGAQCNGTKKTKNKRYISTGISSVAW